MRVFLSLFIVLHCLAAEGSTRVTIAQPITSIVASDPQLREACAAAGSYTACTRFVAFRIEAGCSRFEEGWRVIGASATFRPYILLRDLHALSHEHQHIEDLRQAVDGLLVEMEQAQFESEAGCRARIAAERGAFGVTMQRFARESNLARHPQLRKGGR